MSHLSFTNDNLADSYWVGWAARKFTANGTTWTLVGTIYLDTGTTVDIGLATTASAIGSTETATYKNVTLTGL